MIILLNGSKLKFRFPRPLSLHKPTAVQLPDVHATVRNPSNSLILPPVHAQLLPPADIVSELSDAAVLAVPAVEVAAAVASVAALDVLVQHDGTPVCGAATGVPVAEAQDEGVLDQATTSIASSRGT